MSIVKRIFEQDRNEFKETDKISGTHSFLPHAKRSTVACLRLDEETCIRNEA